MQSVEAALIMLLLGINGENNTCPWPRPTRRREGKKAPNVLSRSGPQRLVPGHPTPERRVLPDRRDETLVITIDPGKARYFSVPVTNDWTITNNYRMSRPA